MGVRWIVAGIAVVIAVVVAVVSALFTFVIVSARIPASFIQLSSVVSDYGLYLIPLGLVGILLAAVLFRSGTRRIGVVTGVFGAVVTLAACVPLVASSRAADRHGTRLSLSEYVSGDAAAAPRPRVSHVYQRVGRAELRLDVKLPHGDSPGLRPAVVWVHGGGWVAGNRAEGGMWHRWLNDRGYAVFAVDYRLAPPPRWNQAPGDVLCAIGWVKQHAAQYHVDPNRMVIAGGSAGGNLALMAAYADARVRPSCPVADSSVRAVMALYPGSDLVTLWHDTGPHAIRVAVQKYTGGTPWQYPERYAAASPITYVRRGIPPTLLLHGTRDHISPFVLATELDDKLAAAGVEHELLAVPYGEHVFDLAWGDWGTQISRRVFARFLDRYCPAES